MKLNPNKKFPKNSFIEFDYVAEGDHSETFEEDVSGKTPRQVMSGIMKEARISNADYVHWQGLYRDDKKLAGKKKLTELAVKVSNAKRKMREIF